jgi:hypothetical protein
VANGKQASRAGILTKANGYIHPSQVGLRPANALRLANACVAAIDAAQSDLPPSAGTRNAKRVSDELFFGLGDEIMYHCTAFSNAELIISTLRTFCDGFGGLCLSAHQVVGNQRACGPAPRPSKPLSMLSRKIKLKLLLQATKLHCLPYRSASNSVRAGRGRSSPCGFWRLANKVHVSPQSL